jgi:inner membrane protein
MAPDLDVLIRSSADPLLFLEYHRQFTHALLFIPVGALLCALPLHLLARRWFGFAATYGFCLLGYASHGLLDACTSYGTELLWPFSDARIAWNRVSVVDPAFTLPLVVLLVLALVRRRARYARLGLLWGLGYLALGVLQGERAQAAAEALARERGHRADELTVKPSFGNLLVWKTLYVHDGRYHVDAVRLAGDVRVYPGETVARLDAARDLPWLAADSQQARDVERFRRFSAGHLALDPDDPYRVVDVRYSMVPNQIDPLWGIELEPAAPEDRHARFFTERRPTPAQRRALVRMVRGGAEPAPAPCGDPAPASSSPISKPPPEDAPCP